MAHGDAWRGPGNQIPKMPKDRKRRKNFQNICLVLRDVFMVKMTVFLND